MPTCITGTALRSIRSPERQAGPRLAASAALAVMLTLAGCQRQPAAPTAEEAARTEGLYAACMDAMVRSTCVATGSSGSGPSAAASTVFIAGVGSVDAQSYREIREAGDAMCRMVRNSCIADPSSPQCSTASALWSSAAPAVPALPAAPTVTR